MKQEPFLDIYNHCVNMKRFYYSLTTDKEFIN